MVLAMNGVDNTLDSGFYRPASVGNFVWLDTNQNGMQDPGEPGVAGVTVALLDTYGTTVATTVTDAAGAYGFTNLRPGSYSIQVMEPADKAFTKQKMGDAAGDSNVDRKDGKSEPFMLTSGMNDPTIDAGLVEVGAVAGVVYVDANRNKAQDANERPIANVTIELVDMAGTVVATTETDADGKFLIPKVPVGDYTVRQVQPVGYTSTTDDSFAVSVLSNTTAQSAFGEVKKDKLPETGAQIGELMGVAFAMFALGSVLVMANRRRRTAK
jgi:serine-aspartate repeat-containing protein C/D/E